jgi:RNA polymerase sigma-70 factor (ECF subfamily)
MREPDRRTTEMLARQAAERDSDAFAELFRRVRGRLEMWIALRMGPLLRSRLTVDDVLQETFLQAHRSLESFRDEGEGSFRRWIFSVAENRLKDLHKFHGAQKRTPVREAPSFDEDERRRWAAISADGTSPSSGAHRADVTRRMTEAIERLPEELREVLVLRSIEERTFREVAERLERPTTSVKGLYSRALRELRDDLRSGPAR